LNRFQFLKNIHYLFILHKLRKFCCSQKYGEVETEFTRRHVGQLCEYWKVKKNDTDFHKIRFNLDYENPLILVQGWNEFNNFHDLPKNVEIRFMYRGNNIYEIMETNDLDSRIHIPAFHSRSSLPTRTATFEVELTNLNVDRPKLVSSFNKSTITILFNFEI
jgi:hypothetical protein